MEDLEIYQIVVPLVSVAFISSIIFHYKRGEVSLPELVIWFFFWVSLAVIAVIPDLVTTFIANLLGFKSNVNAFIFMTIGILFYLQFRSVFAINKLNKKLTEVVRKVALEEAEKE
jgi:hypothetical protein